MQQVIAIQGYEGCFHQIAAHAFFGSDSAIQPCATFHDVVQSVCRGEVYAGVMAIENSIVGSILPNYALLHKSGVRIVGEVYIPIRQHLLVYPGVRECDIREVHSHPMALFQCQEFLAARSWNIVETVDTALSARHVREQQWRDKAVVAGSLAAELFQLEIAVADIHSVATNYTRFLVLQHVDCLPSETHGNKASLLFSINHTCGSIARVLSGIAACGANMSHLQSIPIPNAAWQYSFHIDIEFCSQEQWDAVLESLRITTNSFHLYGVYASGRTLQECAA